MPSSPLDRIYETVLISAAPGDPHYVEGCAPDLYFHAFGDINLDQVAELGARHLLADVDGTLIATHEKRSSIAASTVRKLIEIQEDDRFKTLSLATENGAYPEDLLESLGIAKTSTVFQPWEAGRLGTSWKTTERFWRKILFELDCFEEPQEVAMIGDSLMRDIQPAQALGLRTVHVDRLERRLRPDGPLPID